MGDRAGFDVAVVGAGPAGLATAAFAARAGVATVVLEEKTGPPDKACGEGLMPAGVRVLDALGAMAHLGPSDWHGFSAVRYVQRDGSWAEGRLPDGGGRGIRRTALTAALATCARDSGAEVRWGCAVSGFSRMRDGLSLSTAGGEVTARVLVAADGLHSRIRSQAGLARTSPLPPRFGLRQHFQLQPWSDRVEVHIREGIQAYVTPAGATRVGVAFLWDKGAVDGPASFATFLRLFPALAARLAGASPDSTPRGAGPLAQGTLARAADRLVLVGDAAGYVDAITGEGLSLALTCAQALGAILPGAIARGATARSFAAYDRLYAGEFRRYAVVCRAVLALARRPAIRGGLVRFLGRRPRVFNRLIALALG